MTFSRHLLQMFFNKYLVLTYSKLYIFISSDDYLKPLDVTNEFEINENVNYQGFTREGFHCILIIPLDI